MIKKLGKVVFVVLLFGLVTAIPANAQDINLQWDPVTENITGYKIYYDTEKSGPPYNGTGATEGSSPVTMTLSQTGEDSPEATLHNLPGQKTWFVVTSYNATEESGYSNEVSTSLCAPGGLTITASSVNITINVEN